jgi:tRNA pseudouridine65 synthase
MLRVLAMPDALPVLHLDADLVAIDKPAGLLVHPSALDAHEERTALRTLEHQLGQKLFPLHRLDKATSGVLLFARSRRPRSTGDRRSRPARWPSATSRWCAAGRRSGTIDQPLARDPELPSAGQVRLPAAPASSGWPASTGRSRSMAATRAAAMRWCRSSR